MSSKVSRCYGYVVVTRILGISGMQYMSRTVQVLLPSHRATLITAVVVRPSAVLNITPILGHPHTFQRPFSKRLFISLLDAPHSISASQQRRMAGPQLAVAGRGTGSSTSTCRSKYSEANCSPRSTDVLDCPEDAYTVRTCVGAQAVADQHTSRATSDRKSQRTTEGMNALSLLSLVEVWIA